HVCPPSHEMFTSVPLLFVPMNSYSVGYVPLVTPLTPLTVFSCVGLMTSGPGRPPFPFEPPRQLAPVSVVHAADQCWPLSLEKIPASPPGGWSPVSKVMYSLSVVAPLG